MRNFAHPVRIAVVAIFAVGASLLGAGAAWSTLNPLSSSMAVNNEVGKLAFVQNGGTGDDERSQTKTLAFASGTDWTTYGQDPGATLAGAEQRLAPAQRVCMSLVAPPSCAAGATVYASPFSGWTADLSPIPGAAWIWAPGIDGSTPTADLAHFFFAKRFVLGGQPTGGTIYVAVDDFAAVWVNGVRVGSIGSITDSSLAGKHTFLTKFDITGYLKHGPNVIAIEAQNGPAYFSGLCTTCTYALNPAGVVFGGTLTYTAGAGGSRDEGEGAKQQLLFLSNRAAGDREIYASNTDGSGVRRLTFNSIFERAPRWSPDGTKIAFTGFVNGNGDIYTINADGSGLRQLTTDTARDDDPSWSSNGRQIVYDRGLAGDCSACSLRIVNADGTGDRALDAGVGNAGHPDVSTRNQIAFTSNRSGLYAIHTMPLDGGHVRQVTSGALNWDFQPRWSPDGRRIAFIRGNDAGTDQDLFTVRADGSDLRRLTDTPSRIELKATYSGDGTEIVFFATDGHLYSIRPDGSNESVLAVVPQAPFVETFDDGRIDSSLWHTISDPGGTVAVVGGRLVESIAHDAVPGGQFNQVAEHIGSQCSLNGDFDVQIDYTLLVWPSNSGFFASLNAFFADGAVARVSTSFAPPYDESYNAWTNGPEFSFGAFNTTDRSGQMRLIRRAGVLYAYARSGPTADWALVHAGPATGNAVIGAQLNVPASSFAHVDGKVAYDNIRFNSGALTCPSWWADAWPDLTPGSASDD